MVGRVDHALPHLGLSKDFQSLGSIYTVYSSLLMVRPQSHLRPVMPSRSCSAGSLLFRVAASFSPQKGELLNN